jgi:hypothetical protein
VTRSRQWVVLALLLIVLGGLIFTYKVVRLGFPAMPDDMSEQWIIQARLEVRPQAGSVRASLMLPVRASGFMVSEENFISRGFGLTVDEDMFRREAEWAIRHLRSDKTLYYRATIIRDTGDRRFADTPDFPPRPVLEEPFASALKDLI